MYTDGIIVTIAVMIGRVRYNTRFSTNSTVQISLNYKGTGSKPECTSSASVSDLCARAKKKRWVSLTRVARRDVCLSIRIEN